jgi:hypothetical protein
MSIPGRGQTDPELDVFLLIGQSNMAGPPLPAAEDLSAHPRVRALGYSDCPDGRRLNQWHPASPPLHGCDFGVGPGDYFGKVLAEAYPEATIGLVPCAIPGVDIDYFRKGVVSRRRAEFAIPPDNRAAGAYEWVIGRARLAQQAGVVRGILFHQGESDAGDPDWPGKVEGIIDSLRLELGIGPVPFVAGELLHGGACERHNPLIGALVGRLENAHLVSAQGLTGYDEHHFDLPAQRELGKRYASAMLAALAQSPRPVTSG